VGAKLIKLAEIKFQDTDCDIPESRIVYNDLVQTLKYNSSKYLRPEVDLENNLVKNSIMALAARDAGLEKIIVETQNSEDHLQIRSTSKKLFVNYVFFESNIIDSSNLSRAFSNYLEECKKVFSDHVVNFGKINSVKFNILDKNVLEFSISGLTESPDNKHELYAVTKKLYSEFEKSYGKIRSVNGIKLE
jgi:hypothetical protein